MNLTPEVPFPLTIPLSAKSPTLLVSYVTPPPSACQKRGCFLTPPTGRALDHLFSLAFLASTRFFGRVSFRDHPWPALQFKSPHTTFLPLPPQYQEVARLLSPPFPSGAPPSFSPYPATFTCWEGFMNFAGGRQNFVRGAACPPFSLIIASFFFILFNFRTLVHVTTAPTETNSLPFPLHPLCRA